MVAGAGSGKTTSLIKALDKIRETRGADLRARGQQVACITYTEIAVSEIRQEVGNDDLFHVSTIHSFLWTVIKPFQTDIKEWVKCQLQKSICDALNTISNSATRQPKRDKAKEQLTHCEQQINKLKAITDFRYGTGSNYAEGILGHSDVLKIGPDFIGKHTLMKTVLKQRFPIILVDESQDSSPPFVNALLEVAHCHSGEFCIGFFGDPMQKIYSQGIGEIPTKSGWTTLTKQENFRCPPAVLRVINKIRAESDDLQQTNGRSTLVGNIETESEGTARVLIVPAVSNRMERLKVVRNWLARSDNDEGWTTDGEDSKLKVLVLVHRSAASGLNFANLYSALNDKACEKIKAGLVDGTAWVVRPFLSYILPLVAVHEEGRTFEVMQLLRKHSPRLQPSAVVEVSMATLLDDLRNQVDSLVKLFRPEGDTRIGEVVKFIVDSRLAEIDSCFAELIHDYMESAGAPTEKTNDNSGLRFMHCRAAELIGYQKYIEQYSPFATQQGVKGAEFEKVLVIIDTRGDQYSLFSYEKYFGVKGLSDKDQENRNEGKDSVIDRTRRLFYVCCSRALSDLAVVIFAEDCDEMCSAVSGKGFFRQDDVTVLRGI